jgi:DNA polymerase delta subunit 1
MFKKYQIIEITDYYEQLENFIVLFCKDEESNTTKLRIKNCPLTICKAVGENYKDVSFLWSELNNYLIKRPPQCNKLGCSCQGDAFGVYRHPCIHERMNETDNPVVDVKIVRSRGFDMYEKDDRPFVQVTLNKSYYVQSASKFLEKFDVGFVNPVHRGIYDKTSNGVDEFLLSKRVGSFDWIQVPETEDLTVDYKDVTVVTSEMGGKETEIISLYLDIETIKLTVNEPYSSVKTRNAEYLVGIVSTTLVSSHGKPSINKSFMLKLEEQEDLPDEETTFYDDERDLLMDLRNYILEKDVDVFIGYNSNLFDFPYLLRRAERLGLPDFKYFSRLPGEEVVFRETVYESKQSGARVQCSFNCPGRIFLDVYPMVRKSYKYDSYKLNAVAKEFRLPVAKDDIDPADIPKYYYGTKENRSKLLKYCKKDVLVTLILGEKEVDVVRRMVAMARLYGVSAQQVPDRGNSYLLGMMLRKKMGNDYFPNSAKFDETLRATFDSIDGYTELWYNALDGKKYPGAFVFDPKAGLWKCCVMTLDFNSLYPSVMITFNICLSTQVQHADKNNPDLNISPSGYAYVKEHVKKGLLPELVAELIDERNAVKKRMKNEKDPSRISMMDAEQNALKIAANSYYGLMGSTTSILSSISAAYSVTAYGRFYIQKTCDALMEIPNFEEKYGHKIVYPGFIEKYGLEIIYGDTDSLFIALNKIKDVDLVMKSIGNEIKDWVNDKAGIFVEKGRLKMAFENCSYPFYIKAKKKYVKVIKDKETYLKFSGMGNRSLTQFNKSVMIRVFELKLLEHASQDYIEAFIAESCRKLWHGEVPIRDLKHSANLPRDMDTYDTDNSHIIAAKQLREAMMEVNVGDRIAYYFCNLATLTNKKSETVIAAELLTTEYELNHVHYVNEINDNLSKTISLFISGRTDAERLKRLTYLCNLGRKNIPIKLKSRPKSISSGPINQLMDIESTKTVPKGEKVIEEDEDDYDPNDTPEQAKEKEDEKNKVRLLQEREKVDRMMKLIRPFKEFLKQGEEDEDEMDKKKVFQPAPPSKKQKVAHCSLAELFKKC